MKPVHLAVMGIVMSIIVWGSLFFTVLNQSSQTHQLLRNDSKLLAQQQLTLDSISANARTRTQQLNKLQAHIDCLFNLATQPNRNTTYIKDASTCTLSNGTLPSPTASPAKTTTPVAAQNTPTSTQQGSGTKSEQPATPKTAPKAMPVKSTVCKLTFGLLGC